MEPRFKSLEGNDRYTTPPDIMGCDYMIDIAAEIGLDQAGEPISYQEIKAYCEATGASLTSWEALTLRKMSSAYCEWCKRAADPTCGPPHYTETRSKEQMRADVQNAILEKFKALAKQNKRRKK
jgi:hypothetical protein